MSADSLDGSTQLIAGVSAVRTGPRSGHPTLELVNAERVPLPNSCLTLQLVHSDYCMSPARARFLVSFRDPATMTHV